MAWGLSTMDSISGELASVKKPAFAGRAGVRREDVPFFVEICHKNWFQKQSSRRVFSCSSAVYFEYNCDYTYLLWVPAVDAPKELGII